MTQQCWDQEPRRRPHMLRILCGLWVSTSKTARLWPEKFTGYRISAWKRSIDQPIAIDKRTSLITAIFSNQRVAEAIRCLCEEDVQAFVDVVDEVLPQSFVQGKWLTDLTSCRADIGESRTAAEEEVSKYTAKYAVAMRCFRVHSKSHFVLTDRSKHCTAAGMPMCGWASIAVARSQSRF